MDNIKWKTNFTLEFSDNSLGLQLLNLNITHMIGLIIFHDKKFFKTKLNQKSFHNYNLHREKKYKQF